MVGKFLGVEINIQLGHLDRRDAEIVEHGVDLSGQDARLHGFHRAHLGDGLRGATASSTFHYRLQNRVLDVLLHPRSPWFDGDDAAGDRDRVLRAAAARAVEMLRSRFGDERQQALAIDGEMMGFTHVASGPMVRSSYHADVQAAGVLPV